MIYPLVNIGSWYGSHIMQNIFKVIKVIISQKLGQINSVHYTGGVKSQNNWGRLLADESSAQRRSLTKFIMHLDNIQYGGSRKEETI